MPPVIDCWNTAVQTLSPDDQQDFLVSQSDPRTVLGSILKDAQAKRDTAHQKRWRFTKKNGSTVILRDVLEKIVHAVTNCAKAVDVAVSAAPLHAAPPWAVIRFLLQISTMDLGAFGSMSEGIENVTSVIARYDIIERLYLDSTTTPMNSDSKLLNDFVIKAYIIILRYLVMAKKFWSQNTVKRMVKAPFVDMEAESIQLQKDIAKADEDTYRIIHLLQHQPLSEEIKATKEVLDRLLAETTSPLVRMAQNISDINDKLNRGQRKEILQWLSTVPCESQHEEAASRIVPGTGQWLLGRPEFLEWQRSSTSALLWLHGIPGAGKSKLTSIVINSLIEQHTKSPNPPPLAYFYCSKRGTDVRSKEPSEILCALLRQLTGRSTQLPLRGSVSLEFERRKDLSEGTGAQVPRLASDEAVRHILNITTHDPVIIVIDALDEADDAQRGDLFDSFERILQESQNLVKIFVSSRTDGDIVDFFDQYSNIGIKDTMNCDDIKIFTEFKIQEAIAKKKLLRGRVSSNLRDDIRIALIKGSQGMFRWVELSIETLSNSRRMALEKDVRSELGKLPAELKEQYRVIYKDILDSASATSSIARRTFSWMLAAQRALTVEEMIAAVALDDDGYYHTDLNVAKVLDICRNLLIVVSIGQGQAFKESKERAFQMAHLSVREFLEDLPEFSPQQIHTTATSRLLDNFEPSLQCEIDPLIDGYDGHPSQVLRHYNIYLFEHAEMSLLTDSVCDLAPKMRKFLFDHNYKPTSMLIAWNNLMLQFRERCLLPKDPLDRYDLKLYKARAYELQRYYGSVLGSGFALICLHGLLSLLQYLYHEADFSWEPNDFNLNLATRKGKVSVVKWLLEKYKNVLGKSGDRYGIALYVAVGHKNEEIVKLLLEYGACPLFPRSSAQPLLTTPWYYHFSVHSEAEEHNFNIFKRLFDSIDLLQKDKYDILSISYDWKLEGLFQALKINWEEASLFLIQQGGNDGAYISQQEKLWLADDYRLQPSTLQVAVSCSTLRVVRALLERSSKRNSRCNKPSKMSSALQSREHRAYIDYLDQDGRSALHYLSKRVFHLAEESEGIMKALLEHGADQRIVCAVGWTTLHVAASIGSVDVMRDLMKAGQSVASTDINGATTLHIASRGRHRKPASIRYLISVGQDPLGRDSGGNTPVHYAAAVCNLLVLEALLVAVSGVDEMKVSGPESMTTEACGQIPHAVSPADGLVAEPLNIRNHEGKASLHVIATARQGASEETFSEIRRTVCFLVNPRARVNILAGNETPLLSLLASVHQKKADSLRHLILTSDFRHPYNYRTDSRCIYTAARELLSKGADPNISDSKGCTPLHYTLFGNTTDLVKDLLHAGANMEARDHSLRTPLHMASRRNGKETAEILLLHGADCEARDSTGASPLHYAAKEPMGWRIARMLIRNGANINSVDNSGATPLHYAARFPYAVSTESVLQILVEKRVNINPHDNLGATPLHWATMNSKLQDEQVTPNIQTLIEHGAQVNSIDHAGATPLHYAAKCLSYNCIMILIQNGAKINTTDNFGATPLHWASKTRPQHIMKLLIRSGANPETTDNEGRTPQEYRKYFTGELLSDSLRLRT